MVDTESPLRARGPRADVVRMVTAMPPTWRDDVEAWSLSLRAAGRAETTLRLRVEHVRWLAVAFADRAPADVGAAELVAWMGSRQWARETRRGVRSSVMGFYRWAESVGLVERSPAADLPPVPPSRPNPRPAPDDVYRAALAAAGPRERLMLRLAAECGMRRAEVAQVHSRDLVPDGSSWSLVVHGKGSRERVVPLPRGLAAELRARPAGWLFPGDDGGHLSPRWVGTVVARLLPDAWTMHTLRHRAATRWYAIDRDLLTVGELLGHASPVTTRVYVRPPTDARRRLVEAAS